MAASSKLLRVRVPYQVALLVIHEGLLVCRIEDRIANVAEARAADEIRPWKVCERRRRHAPAAQGATGSTVTQADDHIGGEQIIASHQNL